MDYLSTFKRTEKKYLLTREQYDALISLTGDRMNIDGYGHHTICNIYFDTDDYRLIRESIEKPDYKEKMRIRCYGIADDESTVFLELKKKYKGVVYKRRAAMTAAQARDFVFDRTYPFENQVLHEIEYFMDFYKCVPKVFIAYDRVAMTTPDDINFRVTFDTNIRSRMDDLLLTLGDRGTPLLKDGYTLMEVKAVKAMPRWFSDALNELEIYPSSFSKYGNIYKMQIFPVLYPTNNDNTTRRDLKCFQAFSQQPQQLSL